MNKVLTKFAAFSPGNLSSKELEALLVGKKKEIEGLVNSIWDAGVNKTAPPQNLIVAPRGYGKTHIVNLVFNRLKAKDVAGKNIVLALFKEEEHVHSYLDFLRRILIAIDSVYPSQQLKDEIDYIYINPNDVRTIEVESFLKEFLKDRLLVIILENFGDILEGLKKEGQQKLRAFSQEFGQISLLCTAQRLFEPVEGKDYPFYGYFNKTFLKPFNSKETNSLLTKLARFSDDEKLVEFLSTSLGRSRVRAVRELTSGNPRLITLLSSFLDREKLEELTGAFMELIETSLTPYYQEQMSRLSPLQKRIVEVLCEKGDGKPLSVKEIAHKALTSSQSISAQLRKMEELGVLFSRKRGRVTFYGMDEPLWRVSIEVKNNTTGILPIIVQFLKIINTPEDLFEEISRFGDSLDNVGKCLMHAFKESVGSLRKLERDRFIDAKMEEMLGCLPGDLDKAINICSALSQTINDAWLITLMKSFNFIKNKSPGFTNESDLANEENTLGVIIGESWKFFANEEEFLIDEKCYLAFLNFNIRWSWFNVGDPSVFDGILCKYPMSVAIVTFFLDLMGHKKESKKWLLSYSRGSKNVKIGLRAIYMLEVKRPKLESDVVFEFLECIDNKYYEREEAINLLGHVFLNSEDARNVGRVLEIIKERLSEDRQAGWFLGLAIMIIKNEKNVKTIWASHKSRILEFVSELSYSETIQSLLFIAEEYSQGNDEIIVDLPQELRNIFEKAKKG